MTDFRALCAELVNRFDELYGRICDADTIIYVDNEVNELMNYARAALAEPEPEGPTERQLMMLADDMEMASVGDAAKYARAVLARWGTPNLAKTRSSLGNAPQPVPVSERLPRPEDCDGEGKCWWFHDEDNASCSHWLPAHALPLPTTND